MAGRRISGKKKEPDGKKPTSTSRDSAPKSPSPASKDSLGDELKVATGSAVEGAVRPASEASQSISQMQENVERTDSQAGMGIIERAPELVISEELGQIIEEEIEAATGPLPNSDPLRVKCSGAQGAFIPSEVPRLEPSTPRQEPTATQTSFSCVVVAAPRPQVQPVQSRPSGSTSRSLSAAGTPSSRGESIILDSYLPDHTKKDFLGVHQIRVPYLPVSEKPALLQDTGSFGSAWQDVLLRNSDTFFLDAFTFNYPRKYSPDIYASRITKHRSNMHELIKVMERIINAPHELQLLDYIRSQVIKSLPSYVMRDIRMRLMQRVRHQGFFSSDELFKETFSITSTSTLYSPYFTLKSLKANDFIIIAAHTCFSAALVFHQLAEDALDNGRLLCVVAYGRWGLRMAAKYVSITHELESYSTLELLFHQVLTTALVRLAVYADLDFDDPGATDEVERAFFPILAFLDHQIGSEDPDAYMPPTDFKEFAMSLLILKRSTFIDKQLEFERLFLFCFRSSSKINDLTLHMKVPNLSNLAGDNNPTIRQIMAILMESDNWEDPLSYYSSNNLGSVVLRYKAQIASCIANFVTDYLPCYQYALSKLALAIKLEQMRVPNINICFHEQCLETFTSIQLDCALRCMWELQDANTTHETVALLQLITEKRFASWIPIKFDEAASLFLAHVLLVDYTCGLESRLSEPSIKKSRTHSLDCMARQPLTKWLFEEISTKIWDRMERLMRVMEKRSLHETLRLIKLGYYLLPVLMNYFSKHDPDAMVEMYELAKQNVDTPLSETREDYKHVKDPHASFGQKQLHDFTKTFFNQFPQHRLQSKWPKTWRVEDPREFEHGNDSPVYATYSQRCKIDHFNQVYSKKLAEINPNASPQPRNIGPGQMQNFPYDVFQSDLSKRSAQFVVRCNDFELDYIKNELDLIEAADPAQKVEDVLDFLLVMISLIGEVYNSLLEMRDETVNQIERDMLLNWARTVDKLLASTERSSISRDDPMKTVFRILLEVAFTFGFPTQVYMNHQPSPED